MSRDKLVLYLYEEYETLVSKEVIAYSWQNLDELLDKQADWDSRKYGNTSVLRRENMPPQEQRIQ